MRYPTLLLRSALAAAMLILSASTLAAEDTIKFGLFTPLTGASAMVGLDMQRGVQLGIERINAGFEVPLVGDAKRRLGPGVLGKRIDLVVADDESQIDPAVEAVRRLIDVDKVAIVLGEYSSGRTRPAGEWSNGKRVVHIAIGANSPGLRGVGPYFFDVIGLATLQGPWLVELARSTIGAETFATLFPSNSFGAGVEIAACEAARLLESACVTKIRYEEQKPDYRAELEQVRAAGADAVLFFAYGSDAPLILRQAKELGLDVAGTWFSNELSNWAPEVGAAPDLAEGIRGIEHAVGGERYQSEYVERYRERFGEAPLTVFGAFGYDAAILAALAIDKAKATNSDSVRRALSEVSKEYRGLTGDLTFDEDGMRISQDYGVFIYRNGALLPLEH